MNKRKNYVFVWPVYTRVIHWLIASTFIIAFILSLYENLLNLHVAIGIIFGLMLIYRTIWGFIGPKYATFNTFKLSLKQLKKYFQDKIKDRYRDIPAGHNPASSWFTLIVLGIGSLISISGLLLYGIQEGKGYLSYLNNDYYIYIDQLFLIHKILAYILLFWVVIHISGVLVEQFYHKTNMVFTMINGYKKANGEDSTPGKSQNILTYTFLILSIFVLFVSTDGRHNPFVISKFIPINYETEQPTYAYECGSCHKPYPPFMLPNTSWERIKKGLDNHFGEEILYIGKDNEHSISKNDQTIIFNYLKNNSADKSTREISIKVMKSLNGARGRKSITKIKIWKEIHKNIPRYIFTSKQIKDKSNCWACHRNFDKGIIEDIDIQY